MTCTHTNINSFDFCFSGSVAWPPENENRAAHGNIVRVDTCGTCEATRRTNINGMHVEEGPWVPRLTARERSVVERGAPIVAEYVEQLRARLVRPTSGDLHVSLEINYPEIPAEDGALLAEEIGRRLLPLEVRS